MAQSSRALGTPKPSAQLRLGNGRLGLVEPGGALGTTAGSEPGCAVVATYSSAAEPGAAESVVTS